MASYKKLSFSKNDNKKYEDRVLGYNKSRTPRQSARSVKSPLRSKLWIFYEHPSDDTQKDSPWIENKEQDVPDDKPRPYLRFLRMAKLVRMICGVCIAIRRAALEAGFLENFRVDMSTKRTVKGEDGEEEEELNFNLGDFKTKYELTVSQACKSALEKMPDYRTPADIKIIGRTMRQMASFRKYSREMQDMFCKVIRYEFCNKRRVVIRKGHIGYSLYFIFSGSVKIVLEKDEDKVHTSKPVAFLKKGACFGEIALLKECRRNATAVAAEDTELLVVDKDDFIENGLHLRMQEECNFRRDFFRNLDLLSSWPDQLVQDLAFTSRLEEFNHERVIVQDSRTNESLYFVVKGSCDVLRLVDLDRCTAYQRMILQQHNADHIVHTKPGVSLQDLLPSKPSRMIKTVPREVMRKNIYTSAAERSRSITQQSNILEEAMQSPEPEDSIFADVVSSATKNKPKQNNEELELELERKSSFETIGSGVFVRVDNLHDGECFGMESLFEEPKFVSLVSKGCEVIRVPKTQFIALTDDVTLKRLQELIRRYPSDAELCRTFLRQNKWDSFKHELLESMVSELQTGTTFVKHLRNFKRMDYLQKHADEFSSNRTPAKPMMYKRQITAKDIAAHQKLAKRDSSTELKENGGLKSTSSHSLIKDNSWDPPDLSSRSLRPFSSPAHPTSRRKEPHSETAPRSSSRPLSRSTGHVQADSKVKAASVYSQGSRCKLQIVKNIESPAHAHRMRRIRFQ